MTDTLLKVAVSGLIALFVLAALHDLGMWVLQRMLYEIPLSMWVLQRMLYEIQKLEDMDKKDD